MWASRLTFEAGGHLVGVDVDGHETAAAVLAACTRYRTTDRIAVPGTFGVRSVTTGRGRRRWVIHHGDPIRHRFADLDRAARGARRGARRPCRRGLDRVGDGGRAGGRDRRPLGPRHRRSRHRDRRRGAAPLWVPTTSPAGTRWVDPNREMVTVGGRTRGLVGIAVVEEVERSPDELRRQVWERGRGDLVAWARAIDRLGPALVAGPDLASLLARARASGRS